MLSTNKEFAENCQLDDWILLVEMLLQWESWMKSERMVKKHVKAVRAKHRYIMYLVKKVGKRTEGMGLKITKFHAVMHITMDILFFGVPLEVDTGSNEMGHKPTKTAAKLTQKNEETFDEQTSRRLEEIHLLDLANEELLGHPLWKHYEGHHHPVEIERKDFGEPRLGGAELHCYFDATMGRNAFNVLTRMKNRDEVKMETDLVDFMVGLQDSMLDFMPLVVLRTNHHRGGQKFRAHTMFMGEVWRDWVLVDWDADGVLPNKIWGFVDLTALPPNSCVDYGGLSDLQPGLYAIVESAVYSEQQNEVGRSSFFFTNNQGSWANAEWFCHKASVLSG